MEQSQSILKGIHHFKVFVNDLDESLDWWQTALGARRREDEDHHTADGRLFAYVIELPGVLVPIELRLSPVGATKLAGFDPLTLVVADRDALRQLAERWDSHGLEHSPILKGALGWLMVINTSDGLSLRIYTEASHPWAEDDNDLGSPWLQVPGGLVTR